VKWLRRSKQRLHRLLRLLSLLRQGRLLCSGAAARWGRRCVRRSLRTRGRRLRLRGVLLRWRALLCYRLTRKYEIRL
jgi:hypothetical protein